MQLRDYQQEAVDSVFDYFREKAGNPVIAMPTGTGKSLVIAGLVKQALALWPGQRFLMLTHVKELIEQNAEKLCQYWPGAPVGVYSAGLRQRDTDMPVIFGGSGSVVNCVERFGHRDLLIIDECHLLSPKADTTYQRIIDQLRDTNPYLKVIGLSATPYRLGQGMLTDGGIFTDVCCNMTGVSAFNRFIEDGHLVPLIPRPTETQFDLSEVGVTNGDYTQSALQHAVDKKDVTFRALTEMCAKAVDRQSWLIFASGTEHAEHVAEMLNTFGISSAAVHSKMSGKERDARITAFKDGSLRCVVNNNVLTTGFDHPPLDFIGMLRPTMSPGLWVQMLGRGTRPSPETHKSDCLVLDFAGNTPRLGPINDPVLPRKRGTGGNGTAPIKICDTCGTYVHAAVRLCPVCETEFTFETKIEAVAGTEELIRVDAPVIEWFDIDRVLYYYNNTQRSKPHIKVEYYCNGGFHKFYEFVHIEAPGGLGKRARDWWRARFPGDFLPETTNDALAQITQLRVPNKIKVWINKRYPEVLGYE